MIRCEKKRIIEIVRCELKIDEIEKDLQFSDFKNFATKKRGSLLKYLSIKLSFSLNILCPPVKTCILCDKTLKMNNKPTQVVVHTVTGPELYSKYIYRCRDYKLVKNEKLVLVLRRCRLTNTDIWLGDITDFNMDGGLIMID